MKWCDLFDDPDMVGTTAYLAIHDAVALSAMGCENPYPDRELDDQAIKDITEALDEIVRQAKELKKSLIGQIG